MAGGEEKGLKGVFGKVKKVLGMGGDAEVD